MKKYRVFYYVHQIYDRRRFDVLNSFALQVQRNLRSSSKSIAARVWVDVEGTFLSGRTEDVLDRMGIFCTGRRE